MTRTLRFLLSDLRHVFRWRAGAYLVAAIANGLLEGMAIVLLFPLLALIGIGEGTSTNNPVAATVNQALTYVGVEPALGPVLVSIIALFILQNVVFLTQGWLAAHIQNDYIATWRERLFSACLAADWRFHLQHRNADLVNVIIVETGRVGIACHLVGQILSAGAIAAIYLGIVFLTAWQATTIILACATVIVVLTHRIVRHGRTIGARITRDQSELTHEVSETFAGMKVIKAMAVEDPAQSRVANLTRALARHYFWIALQPNLLRSLFEVVIIGALATVLFIGAQFLDIGVAALLVVVALFIRLYPRVSTLQQNMQALYAHLPAVDEVRSLRQAATDEQEIKDCRDEEASWTKDPSASRTHPRPPEIRAEALSVHYGEAPALQGIEMTLPAAATTAIIGPSGAGKTTFVDCLLRLVPPADGRILIDGQPLSDLPLKAWRRRIGYVPQDTFLFNASIRDNIAWSYPNATDEQIVRAARRANAHDFIMATNDGYATIVGDRGMRLSGGQRQRIGLARALLMPTTILILDEATSALDSEAEAEVMSAIRDLHGEITIVIIAHRLSTVRDADIVYVLDQGRILEHGSWQDLLSKRGRLKALWDMQTGSAAN